MTDDSKSNPQPRKVVKREGPDAFIPDITSYIALDCEFVGVGHRKTSALGRLHLPL